MDLSSLCPARNGTCPALHARDVLWNTPCTCVNQCSGTPVPGTTIEHQGPAVSTSAPAISVGGQGSPVNTSAEATGLIGERAAMNGSDAINSVSGQKRASDAIGPMTSI